jgi:hypothetical protein
VDVLLEGRRPLLTLLLSLLLSPLEDALDLSPRHWHVSDMIFIDLNHAAKHK